MGSKVVRDGIIGGATGYANGVRVELSEGKNKSYYHVASFVVADAKDLVGGAGKEAGEEYGLINLYGYSTTQAPNIVDTEFIEGSKWVQGFATSSSIDNWNVQPAPIPEPTSGLLMLLGMAGLALKRKRA